jgi:hypothetical protein
MAQIKNIPHRNSHSPPFGETFFEDRHDHQRTPSLFNGKGWIKLVILLRCQVL